MSGQSIEKQQIDFGNFKKMIDEKISIIYKTINLNFGNTCLNQWWWKRKSETRQILGRGIFKNLITLYEKFWPKLFLSVLKTLYVF